MDKYDWVDTYDAPFGQPVLSLEALAEDTFAHLIENIGSFAVALADLPDHFNYANFARGMRRTAARTQLDAIDEGYDDAGVDELVEDLFAFFLRVRLIRNGDA